MRKLEIELDQNEMSFVSHYVMLMCNPEYKEENPVMSSIISKIFKSNIAYGRKEMEINQESNLQNREK